MQISLSVKLIQREFGKRKCILFCNPSALESQIEEKLLEEKKGKRLSAPQGQSEEDMWREKKRHISSYNEKQTAWLRPLIA